ncbi:hypothetical protein [Haloterrigena alkaliphila]|uniref:Uncharacterized protein n=1 Tax=Haloterrigena alkaliphila TaxID=2816475 RepID=A0A8A2VHT7_9EURY|nr:hypothetical protein [Haloterrigena alkaliphila]QSW97778.1 hypothetical protein J0X25_10130 [Haloterrigena alkaliphila]
MTPVVLLVVFCAAMAAVAVGRLAIADERDPADIGTALVGGGVTVTLGYWEAPPTPNASGDCGFSGWLPLETAGSARVRGRAIPLRRAKLWFCRERTSHTTNVYPGRKGRRAVPGRRKPVEEK